MSLSHLEQELRWETVVIFTTPTPSGYFYNTKWSQAHGEMFHRSSRHMQIIKIRFPQLKGLRSTKNKGFNSKHMREIKYVEEKWILEIRDPEPHSVNFKRFFFFICLVFWFLKKEKNS